MSDIQWHYAVGGEQKGPVTVADLQILADAGVIDPQTLVWSPQITQWQPLQQTRLAESIQFLPASGGGDPHVSIGPAPPRGFLAAVSTCFKRYADFNGRSSRSEFWYFMLFLFLLFYALYIPSDFSALELNEPLALLYVLIAAVVGLGTMIPSWSVTVRRLHDIGRSGWCILLYFVPFVGPIILLVLYCKAPTPGRNRYG